MIAGFERLESGVLRLGGETVDDGRRSVLPQRRRIGYVPQDGALFPHLRVAANVGFGLGRRADRNHISSLLETVGLQGMEAASNSGWRSLVRVAGASAPV